MKRSANAQWNGNLKEGNGTVSLDSGVLSDAKYSFKTRFEEEKGTNPEELVAAAHASCFAMALSNELAKAGMNPTSVKATATVTLEQKDGGFAVTKSHLVVDAHVPGADQSAFDEAANSAKSGCPISKLLNAEITMETSLKS